MDNSFWAKGSTGPAWPVTEDGTKEKAVLLRRVADHLNDAEMTISLLAAYGIPCFKYYDKDGLAGRVITGFSDCGAGLYVPESLLEEAQAILSADVAEEK